MEHNGSQYEDQPLISIKLNRHMSRLGQASFSRKKNWEINRLGGEEAFICAGGLLIFGGFSLFTAKRGVSK